jgi:hypothetical protein
MKVYEPYFHSHGVPMKTIVVLILATVTASAQMAMHDAPTTAAPTTDPEKIADALRAGPDFITRDATIMDWPATKGGEYRVLRQGTSEWTCLPGPLPGYTHDEPGCFDKFFFQWLKDGLAGRPQHIDKVGLAYMYVGAWVPNKSGKTAEKEFHVGPHIMVVSPHPADLQNFNRDGSNGMSYATHLKGGDQLFLVIPIRQADQP